MLAGMRSYAQALANGFMETPIVIRHRKPPDKDDENPFGDDTTEWETTTTSTTGWYVSSLTKSFSDDGGMTAVTEQDLVRLPVGTDIKERDQVQIAGEWWVVTDASQDETWPAMLKVAIVRKG